MISKYKSLLVFFGFLLFATVLMAQTAPSAPAAPTQSMGIAQTVIVLAGVVASILQGVKQLVPQINGKVAIAISIAASLALAYAAAQPGQVISIQFLITTLGTALGSNGIYDFLKKPKAPVPAA